MYAQQEEISNVFMYGFIYFTDFPFHYRGQGKGESETRKDTVTAA